MLSSVCRGSDPESDVVCGRAINGRSTDGPGNNLLSVELTDSYRVRRRQMQMKQICVWLQDGGGGGFTFGFTIFLALI